MLLPCVGCFVASPPMRFGAGKSPEEAQRQTLATLMPPQLTADPEWHGEIKTLQIRVWADDEFRAQNVQWQRTFGEELEYANSVLEPLLGIHLAAEYKVWQRHAPGATLEEDLAALVRQDPGDGVFTVVGLTSALALASATFDELGVASMPGNHLMLRGYADRQEGEAFERAFPKISGADRQIVVEARRRHKTAATLLHELGHNFSAHHDDLGDTIMSPIYSDHSAVFSPDSRAAMIRAVNARLGRSAPALAVRASKHPSLVLDVGASGDVRFGGQPVDADTLAELYRRSLANDAETEVVLRPDRATRKEVVTKLLDQARAAGFHRTSIVQPDN